MVNRLIHGDTKERGTLWERRQAMDRLLNFNYSYSEIARRVGVSTRTVERYARRNE